MTGDAFAFKYTLHVYVSNVQLYRKSTSIRHSSS